MKKVRVIFLLKNSEYDQEIPQSQNADNPVKFIKTLANRYIAQKQSTETFIIIGRKRVIMGFKVTL